MVLQELVQRVEEVVLDERLDDKLVQIMLRQRQKERRCPRRSTTTD